MSLTFLLFLRLQLTISNNHQKSFAEVSLGTFQLNGACPLVVVSG